MSKMIAMVWIITTAHTECAGCDAHLSPGDHVLWLPEKPVGANNLCLTCGESKSLYPGPSYWQAREERLRQQKESRLRQRRATHVR